MTLSPNPQFPERITPVYEETFGQNMTRRGPLRFEEGVATDTDIPNSFALGISQGYITAPGRPNHNANVYVKSPQETLAERAHVGSAAWVEAPTVLSEFVQGSFTDYDEPSYETVIGTGNVRQNPAVVTD